MSLDLTELKVGESYSRPDLASRWGYSSFHAIARGVVTPKNDNKIILFVTEDKQQTAEQYADRLLNDCLEWEGPNDHFAEQRILSAEFSGDEIHLFHRNRHHSDFVYRGTMRLDSHSLRADSPSQFKFKFN
jgi:Domain of unknown function (DUF3427)